MSENVPDESAYNGVSLEEWERAYAPGMSEFGASRFLYSTEGGQVRIAFGSNGPFQDAAGRRQSPRFSHAVTLSAGLAVELAQKLLATFAEVKKPGS